MSMQNWEMEGFGLPIDENPVKAGAFCAGMDRDLFDKGVEDAAEYYGVKDPEALSRLQDKTREVTEDGLRAALNEPAEVFRSVADCSVDSFPEELAEVLNDKYNCVGFAGVGYGCDNPAAIMYQAVYPWHMKDGDRSMTQEKLTMIFSELGKELGVTVPADDLRYEYWG